MEIERSVTVQELRGRLQRKDVSEMSKEELVQEVQQLRKQLETQKRAEEDRARAQCELEPKSQPIRRSERLRDRKPEDHGRFLGEYDWKS